MNNFDYYNPTRIVFGKDRLGDLDSLIPAGAKVLITFGGGSAQRSGLVGKIKANLGSRAVVEFGGIEPNPRFETLTRAVEVAKRERVDFLLAVGGGSVIDGTKFIALAARCKGDAVELLNYAFRQIPASLVESAIPLGTVLTLPATGSEMNNSAVISIGHAKSLLSDPKVFPQFSILDPANTITLPKQQVVNGIVDAFVHTTEQYLTFPAGGLLQDRMAEGILQTLIEVGPKSVAEPENYEARANHVWSATMALNGLIGVGVPQDWASHMIGHELTALFGIDHGMTLAIVMPALIDVRRDKKRAKLIQYAERVWKITAGGDDEKVDLAIKKTREFFESLGAKTRLSQYSVGADKIPSVLDRLEAHGMVRLSESGDLTLEIAKRILEISL